MRVLALTSSYPRYEGDPTAPFVESITRGLAARGHRVDLVLPAHSEWNRPPGEHGIGFYPCRYSPLASWTPWGYSQSLGAGLAISRPLYALAPLVAISMLRTCSRLARHQRYDVVHTHWVIPNGPLGAWTARRHALPLVISLHGSDISIAQRSRRVGRVASWAFRNAVAVTAPSEDLLDRARSLGAQGYLEVVPYGGDAAAFNVEPGRAAKVRRRLGLADGDVVVLGIGRFVQMKGFDDLVAAVGTARATNRRVKLVLVGDGDLSDELRAQVRTAGLDDGVVFAGIAARDEVPAYYAAADVVAVPSVRYDGYVDGLPNVALEAMAASRPLVATRVGGLPEIVHDGENGLLVPERDPAALAGAIGRLARDAELRRALGKRGRALVAGPLSWDATASRFDAVYRRVRREELAPPSQGA